MKTDSLCQLNDYYFTKLSITCNPAPGSKGFEVANLVSKFDYSIWQNPENPLMHLMRFWASFNEETPAKENFGYQIEAEIFGNLTLSAEIPEDKRPIYIRQNGVSILLGLMRAQIGMNTGCFIGGKLVIPTLMPNEIIKEVQAAKQRTPQPKPPKKTARKNAKSPVKKTPRKSRKAPTS